MLKKERTNQQNPNFIGDFSFVLIIVYGHTYASLLLEEGVQLKVISENLGHKNIKITSDQYTTVTDTVKQDTIPQIDNILDKCGIPK